MIGQRTLELVIAANNQTKKAFAAVQKDMKKTQTIGNRAAKMLRTGYQKVAKAVKAVGKALKTAFTIGLIAAVAAIGFAFITSIKQAAAFEQSMANVKSVLGGTEEEMKKVARAARDMGKTSVFTAQEAASAMYDLASAGFSADQVISSLKGTMMLAAATGSDLTFTTETMTSVLKQFSLEAGDAGRVANTFAATISFSKMNMDRLSTSMSFAGPVAAAFGHSLEGTLSVLAQFANMGLRASMIGTTFRMGLLQLSKAMPIEQIEKGVDVLNRLNISFKNIDPSTNSVADIVEKLHGKVTKMSEAVALFGVRAGGPWLKLIKEGAEPLRELEKKITGTRKAFEMSATQIMTFNGRLRIFKSAVQEAQISLGTAFLPVLTKIVDQFIAWVSIVNQINWTEFFQGFQSGSTEGAKKIEGILNLFRSGGPLRQAVSAWAFFFLDTVVNLSSIIFQPIQTEFDIAVMKMKNLWAENAPWVFGGNIQRGMVSGGKFGPQMQQARRIQGTQQMAEQAKRLLGRRPTEAVARTTEFAGEFSAAFGTNERTVKQEQEMIQTFTAKVVDSLGRTHIIMTDSMADLNNKIGRLESTMTLLSTKVRMSMSSGETQIGAIE